MRTRMIPRLNDQTIPPDSPGAYGSDRTSQFLNDAIRGVDSIDVLVIGDSNAGFAPSGVGGYTAAWHKTMQFALHIPVYATCMMPGGPTNPSALTTGNSSAGREAMWGVGIGQGWNAHSEAGGSNSGTTFKQMIQTAAAAPAGEIAGLMSWLGFNSTDYNVNSTANKMLFPLGWMNNPAVVEAGARFTSSFNNVVTIANQTVAGWNAFGSELAFGTAGTGGHSLQYRIVHGTFPTAGSFKPYAFYLATTGAISRDSSTTSTGGGYGYATKAFTISTFTLASSGNPTRVAFTWDGSNSATAADQANGPFACLWQSVIKPNTKGYSVSCLNYFGGLTTTQIAEKLEDCDKMLDAYLKEVRERQIAAGGSGRVMVFCNSGINGTETTTSWVAGAERIRNRIAARWVSTGGSLSQLSFVLTPTHPTNFAGTNWTNNGAAIRAAAASWAAANASDGYGVSVVDISDAYTPVILTRYAMYDDATTALGQAHLEVTAMPPATGVQAVDGYEAIVRRMIAVLTA